MTVTGGNPKCSALTSFCLCHRNDAVDRLLRCEPTVGNLLSETIKQIIFRESFSYYWCHFRLIFISLELPQDLTKKNFFVDKIKLEKKGCQEKSWKISFWMEVG